MPDNRVDPEVEAVIPGAAAAKAPRPETRDEMERAQSPFYPRGEVKATGGHQRSGFGTGERGAKVREAAKVADEEPMKPGFAKEPGSSRKTALSVEERLELIEAELLASSLSFNKRVNKAYAEKALEASRAQDAHDKKKAA